MRVERIGFGNQPQHVGVSKHLVDRSIGVGQPTKPDAPGVGLPNEWPKQRD